MFKREEADDDFVTKTNRSRKKSSKQAASDDTGNDAGSSTAPASGASTAPSTNSGSSTGDNISLRPRTMFTVKGRGRTESDGSPAYRPQWSKDGDGFVSNTTGAGRDGDVEGRGDSRRKGKVLRYSKEELLALHVETTSPPKFLVETAVASGISLPPVDTIPFDYDEVNKQWELSRNRGRGRGRTNNAGGSQNTNRNNDGGNERSRSNGRWDDTRAKRGDERSRGDGDSTNDRSGNAGDDSIWDDVGISGGDSMELDLSSMAAAAEKFRREMDAMRNQEEAKVSGQVEVTDMDAFDQKLEDAAAAGQFEDSDEEVQWDMPTDVESTRPLEDSPLLFQTSQFDQKASLPEPQSLTLDEPSFSLNSLSAGGFGLTSLAVEVRDEWYYLDPQGMQQGPFKTAEMREWFEAGYFKPNLPIRFGGDGTFTPLANHFLQGQLPFATIPRPSPKMGLEQELRLSEQRRLMELHQQQQQQQQMMRLQQQQEQQRMMQFNQEEKIRLEMQRLELARQQQNHLFQQQQQLIQQQQQQQQQQQMLLQHQSSWQRSQREGIMSALGIFGGDNGMGVKPHFPHEAHQFQPDYRNHHVDMNNAPRPQDPVFHANDPWGGAAHPRSANDPLQQAGFFGSAVNPPVPQDPPVNEAHVANDPWGNPIQQPTEHKPDVPVASFAVEEQQPQRESTPPPAPQDTLKKAQPSPSKEKSKVSPVKKQPQSRATDSPWANAASALSSTKSLKDIQADEQREMRKSLQDEHADLAHMGAQLKMMLGVNPADNAIANPVPVAAAAVKPTTAATSTPTTTPAQAPTPAPGPAAVPPPAPAAPAPSPWGRAAAVAQQPQSKKSMREILEEEERLAAERAKRIEGAASSSHWSNIVAGTASTPAAAPKVSRLGPVPASVLKSTTRQSRTSVSADAVSSAQKKTTTTPSKAESDASFWNFGAAQSASKPDGAHTATATSSFGSGSFSSEFMGWCAKQIKAINGSDDLTLVEYCATLEDPGEIREYLAAYLGSTPRVSAFATEFIQRKKSLPSSKKNAGFTEVSDSADSSSSKKAKRRTKGQKIDPSLLNYSVGS